MKSPRLIFLSACCMICMAACQKEPYQPVTDNAQQFSQQTDAALSAEPDGAPFGTKINNQYFPLKPGTTFYYKHVELDGGELVYQSIHTSVTSEVKFIDGANCRVVHDVVFENGEIIEDTYDYYTQDSAGNVWYYGEDTKALEDGQWTTEGSWLAGRNGAQPGIIMWAHPEDHIGETYRQEYLKDSAEDKGKVLDVNSTVSIQLGTYKNCVATLETNGLEPGVKEYKYYAPGVGVILAVVNAGGNEHEELVKVVKK